MPEIKKLTPINAYKVTFDDGSEQTLVALDAVPMAAQAPAPAPAPQPPPEEEEPNPFLKGRHFSLTRQGQLKKKDPARYQRLRAAAERS